MTARLVADFDAGTIQVGDSVFDVSLERSELPAPYVFSVRRAQVYLDAEHTLSVAWGSCTYSDNYTHGPAGVASFVEDPAQVEIAIVAGGKLMPWAHGDTVADYVPVTKVAEIIDRWPACLSVVDGSSLASLPNDGEGS